MATYLTISDQPSIAVKFRMPAPVSLAGPARIAEPTAARTAQMIGQISWPNAGLMPVPTQAAPQHQDGHIAGFGGCDVTDTKFSTRMGPPSCSPPV
jgi:hypothetical protein